jgi:hypothetical protein
MTDRSDDARPEVKSARIVAASLRRAQR